jgi:hypothetical protein
LCQKVAHDNFEVCDKVAFYVSEYFLAIVHLILASIILHEI